MRRRLLLVATAIVVLSTSGAWAVAASEEPAVRQAWTRTGALPTFLPEDGRVYVAADAGIEQARAFVAAGAGTVRLQDAGGQLEGPSGPLSGEFGDEPALLACPLTTPLTDDGELSADAAPAADCDLAAPVDHDDDEWVVRLDESTPFGVAVIPDLSEVGTFRLAFDAERTAFAAALPAPATAPAATPAPDPAPAADDAPAAPAATAPPLIGVDTALPSFAGGPGDEATVAAAAAPGAENVEIAAASGPTALAQQPPLAAPVGRRGAGSPPAAVVLGLVGLVSLAPAFRLGRRPDRRARAAVTAATAATAASGRWLTVAPLAVAAAALPLLLGEASLYKLGLVLIVIVGAIGLHLLVNWAGELSLAHATMIGLPAFAVAKVSADHGISPILLLPLGIAVGAAAGAVVGAPAIRAKGLQVALVTLAGGIAIDRFFFTKEWVVGPAAGAAVPVPTLGPFELRTARALYPVLVAIVVAAVAAAWMLYRSKLARGLLWVKADQAAAAAFGIPVNRYRALAYVLAGAFAGLAGGLTTMWVQRLTPQAFPLDRSFTYLIIVVLAGRGFLGGVAAAAFAIEGGRLFLANGDALMTYAGPVGLLLTLITNRDGLNGLAAKLRRREPTVSQATTPVTVRPLVVGAVLAIAAGFAAIALAWYHAGNTTEVWVQNQELISGGVGGVALIVLGMGLLIYDRIERLIDVLATGKSGDGS